MRMTDRNPRRAFSHRAGPALIILIGVLVLVVGGLVAATILLRAVPAKRAYRDGLDLLADGQAAEAAEKFTTAVTLDPSFEDAWHRLLDADPSPATCRRFAQHMPQLFDAQQPLPDDMLLVVARARDLARWKQSMARYVEVATHSEDAPAGSDRELIRLDYDGRKNVRDAWDIARKLNDEMGVMKRGGWPSEHPMPFKYLDPFAKYDLAGIKQSIQQTASYFPDTRVWLGALKKIGEAIKLEVRGLDRLKRAATVRETFLPTQLTLAYVAIARGRHAEALRRCEDMLKHMKGKDGAPGVVRARYCLVRALEMAGKPEAAVEQLRAILAVRPQEFQAMQRLALLYLKLDRIDEAEVIAESLTKGSQLDARSAHILGLVHYRRGRYRQAVAELTTAHESQAYDARIHFALGRAMLAAGKRASASREFMRVAIQVDDAAWPTAAASAAALSGGHGKRVREAARLILAQKEWLALHPRLADHARRLLIAGRALEGGAAPTIQEATDLLAGASDKAQADCLIAGVWAAEAYVGARLPMTVSDEKLAFFRKADRPSARYCVAFLLAAAGDIQGARRELTSLTADHPGYAPAALHLARLELLDGKTERAARVLQNDKLDPRIPAVARTLRAIDRLQGLRIERDTPTAGDDPLGPHLALFALTVPDDTLAYARRFVLLDPVGSHALGILEMAYDDIRTQGLKGLVATKDSTLAIAVQHGLAAYVAESGRGTGLYRLAIGRFWQDIPWGP
jgi:tetratricopeptide (TPR) repeat protein